MTQPYYDPLSAADAWFLYAERPETPLDIGTVYIFEGGSRIPGGRGALGIRDTVAERLHLVPRYRQRIHQVRFHLGHPVWIDDPDFDLDYHVRHEVVPAPGDGPAFRAAVARILARPLDMRRPLWDMTVVSGLPDDRVAVVNRAHHAMVDGVSAADIVTVLLDLAPEGNPVAAPAEPWRPRPAPSQWQIIRPILWNPPRKGDAPGKPIRRRMAFWRLPVAGFVSLARSQVRSRPDLFFNRKLGLQRTGRGLKIPLEQVKAMKNRFGCTVNDAVLGIVAEGLHRWFVARGERVPDNVRVFCPVSVRSEDEHGQLGNKVSGMVLDLPTGDASMEDRLRRLHAKTDELKRSHQAVAAEKLTGLAGWAPPQLLILAGRVMPNQQGGANINVTNVPGPQFPLYSGGAEMLEVWPFAPLYPSMGLGIAAVSYNGNIYLGFSADSTLVPDVEDFRRHIRDAAAESSGLATA